MHRSYTVSVNTYENMPEVKGIYTIDWPSTTIWAPG